MSAKSERRAFKAEMRELEMRAEFWLGFTAGAAACTVALLLSFLVGAS